MEQITRTRKQDNHVKSLLRISPSDETSGILCERNRCAYDTEGGYITPPDHESGSEACFTSRDNARQLPCCAASPDRYDPYLIDVNDNVND